RNALNMRTEAKTLRQQMAADIMATNACATLAGRSELERAGSVRATTRFVGKVQSSGLPPSVARYLLQEGYADRLSGLKQIARNLKVAIDEVDGAARTADGLLMLRPEEWFGGPWNAMPIRLQLQKCERASQVPDALEKQITLLS